MDVVSTSAAPGSDVQQQRWVELVKRCLNNRYFCFKGLAFLVNVFRKPLSQFFIPTLFFFVMVMCPLRFTHPKIIPQLCFFSIFLNKTLTTTLICYPIRIRLENPPKNVKIISYIHNYMRDQRFFGVHAKKYFFLKKN